MIFFVTALMAQQNSVNDWDSKTITLKYSIFVFTYPILRQFKVNCITLGEMYVFLLYWSRIFNKTSRIPPENVFKYHSEKSLQSLVTFPGLPYLDVITLINIKMNLTQALFILYYLFISNGKSPILYIMVNTL